MALNSEVHPNVPTIDEQKREYLYTLPSLRSLRKLLSSREWKEEIRRNAERLRNRQVESILGDEELWRKEERNASKVLQLRPTVYSIRKVKWTYYGQTYWNLGMSLGMSPNVLEKVQRSAECDDMAQDWIIPMLTEWLNHGKGTGNKKRTWGTICTAIANECSHYAALSILRQVIDIEGMCAQILSKKPTLQEIEEVILHYLGEDWHRVGELLGMSPKVMKEIGSKFGSVPTQCSEAMFSKWLNCEEGTGHKERTWGTVLTALEDAGRGDVAISVLDKLTVKHKEEEALKKAPNIKVIKVLVIPRVARIWLEIGLFLGIIKATLMAIESEAQKKVSLKQTCEMFQLWLDGREGTGDEDRSWLVILRVLVDIGRSDIIFEIQGHFDLKTKDSARILSLLCDDTQSSSDDIPVSPTTTTVPTTSQGTDQSLVCSQLNDNVGQVSLHDCIEDDGEVEEDKESTSTHHPPQSNGDHVTWSEPKRRHLEEGLDKRGKFPTNQPARSRRRQKLKKQNYGFPSKLGLHMRGKCLVTFDLPGKSKRRKKKNRKCLSEKSESTSTHHPPQSNGDHSTWSESKRRCLEKASQELVDKRSIIASISDFMPLMDKMIPPHLLLLGTALDVSSYTTAVVQGPGNPYSKCIMILQRWLDITPTPTWEQFCERLNSETFNNLRHCIIQNHIL